MPTRDDDPFDAHSIVPDTDDRAAHIVKHRAPPSQHSNSPGSGATPSFAKQAATIFMFIALTGACGLLHYRNIQQQEANAKLQTRLEALESQLGVTVSAASHTSETLGEKVKSLDGRIAAANTEITKLWSVTNDKTRKSLDEHEKTLATLQAAVTDLKKSLGDATRVAAEAKQTADSVNRTTAELGSSLGTLQQRVAQGDPLVREASQQATMAQDQIERLQVKLDVLNKKVSDHDDSLRSIDNFRRSVNSDLGKLKQEHIGPATAPAM